MTNKALLSIGAALLVLPAALQAQTQSTSGALTGRAAAATTGSTAPAGTADAQSPATDSASTTGRTSASASTPQTAAASGKIAAGAMVTDTKGGSVGKIATIDGDFATLDTGTNKVRLPISSFAVGATGPVIAMTKAEVDAAATGAADQDKAALAAMLTPGTKVMDTSGGAVGTIEANDGTLVTVATAKTKAKLPTSAFAKGATGPVIAMTAAQLDAAAKSATPGG